MVAFWGWIIMSLITVCIAVSLGEIASRYPVSGGVYYWSFMLSPPKWAPLVSWIVGWLSVIGNMTVTLTANFGTTQLILASVNSEPSISRRPCAKLMLSFLPGLHRRAMAHCVVFMGIVGLTSSTRAHLVESLFSVRSLSSVRNTCPMWM